VSVHSLKRRAIFWQIYTIVFPLIGVVAATMEILWIILLFYDRSSISVRLSIITHALAITALAMWWFYRRTRAKREMTILLAGDDASLEEQAAELRIGPFPLRVELPFFFMPVFFALQMGNLVRGLAWILTVTFSIVVHELGHAYAARANRHWAHIRLWAFGGLTQHHGRQLTRAQSCAISFAGPATGLVMGGIVWLITRNADLPGNWYWVVNDFIWATLFWSVVNLLPILPLDGGHLLQALAKNGKTAINVSVITGAICIVLSIFARRSFMAIFFVVLTANNLQHLPALRRRFTM